jgi:hypothetical protein
LVTKTPARSLELKSKFLSLKKYWCFKEISTYIGRRSGEKAILREAALVSRLTKRAKLPKKAAGEEAG